jgi:hypothetical protein
MIRVVPQGLIVSIPFSLFGDFRSLFLVIFLWWIWAFLFGIWWEMYA